MVGIGLLGLGTVGMGIVEILEERYGDLLELTGEEIKIVKILVKDKNKKRNTSFENSRITSNFQEILDDERIQIIVEVTGDLEDGYKFIRSSLEKGKHVVTANKAVVAKYFEELSSLAEERKLAFLYEGSVGGGIPILKPLREQLRLNKIDKVRGILNGTCNYILTKMIEEASEYEEALKDAQNLGYAELDPSADVEGHDTLRKLRILGTVGLGGKIGEDDILLEGIERLTSFDIKQIRGLNKTIKLVGDIESTEAGYKAMVIPTSENNKSTLANVNNSFNLVEFSGNNVDKLRFYGQGAGKLPTGNAVLSDVLDIVTNSHSIKNPLGSRKLTNLNNEIEGRFYLRVSDSKEKVYNSIYNISENILCAEENIAVLTNDIRLKDIYEFLNSLNISKEEYFIARMENIDFPS